MFITGILDRLDWYWKLLSSRIIKDFEGTGGIIFISLSISFILVVSPSQSDEIFRLGVQIDWSVMVKRYQVIRSSPLCYFAIHVIDILISAVEGEDTATSTLVDFNYTFAIRHKGQISIFPEMHGKIFGKVIEVSQEHEFPIKIFLCCFLFNCKAYFKRLIIDL